MNKSVYVRCLVKPQLSCPVPTSLMSLIISSVICSSDCTHILSAHGSSAAAMLPKELVRVYLFPLKLPWS